MNTYRISKRRRKATYRNTVKYKSHQNEEILGRNKEAHSNVCRGSGEGGSLLPISARLVNPGKAAAVLWTFPRFGALDDQCLYPSTRAFRLEKKDRKNTAPIKIFPFLLCLHLVLLHFELYETLHINLDQDNVLLNQTCYNDIFPLKKNTERVSPSVLRHGRHRDLCCELELFTEAEIYKVPF